MERLLREIMIHIANFVDDGMKLAGLVNGEELFLRFVKSISIQDFAGERLKHSPAMRQSYDMRISEGYFSEQRRPLPHSRPAE